MTARDVDHGLEARVPFRFECQRSGRCCTSGDGHVFLAEGESDALASRLGSDPTAFRERYTRTVPDPRTGELREALREQVDADGAGRCVLLEGSNECSVYDVRPEQCRRFPFWPSIMESEEGFERARATCPGIEPVVAEAAREAAFGELAELYREVEAVVERSHSVCLARGLCCRFEEADHALYATALEADYAAAMQPDASPPEAPGRCPYHVRGSCTAREVRPLGCRTYFCDPQTQDALSAVHEERLAQIRAIARKHGYTRSYAPFPALLAARGVGRAEGADSGESREERR